MRRKILRPKSKGATITVEQARRAARAVRFRTEKEKHRGGWSDWIYPVSKPGENYLMKCCECGLVHEMQFKAFAEVPKARGKFEVVELPWPIRAMFRARRWRKKK